MFAHTHQYQLNYFCHKMRGVNTIYSLFKTATVLSEVQFYSWTLLKSAGSHLRNKYF